MSDELDRPRRFSNCSIIPFIRICSAARERRHVSLMIVSLFFWGEEK